MEQLLKKVAGIIQRNRKKKWVKAGVMSAACLVVFVTTYALILPAITISLNQAEEEPGFDVASQGELLVSDGGPDLFEGSGAAEDISNSSGGELLGGDASEDIFSDEGDVSALFGGDSDEDDEVVFSDSDGMDPYGMQASAEETSGPFTCTCSDEEIMCEVSAELLDGAVLPADTQMTARIIYPDSETGADAYTDIEETFEEALFKFWNEGLKIFTQSLSGMEIIMNDINSEIIDAIQQDFKFGLFDRIPNIIKLADDMRTTVRKEQNFDAAGFIYRPMYNELRRLINYYAQNENELFARTMTNWASLAGFHGHSNSMGIITYSEQSFVPKSAKNALLIPPRWKDYMSSAQNVFVDNIQRKYSKAKSVRNQERAIRGTFLRKQAIENDYLHFFAPGDAVFDCIVDNAMLSCKGRSSAFAIHAEFNWTGIVYTWSLSANIDYLLESGVSIYALSPYRNYLMSEQIISPISLNNEEDISDVQIIREYNRIVEAGFHPKNVVHLGKRSMSPGFLRGQLEGHSNIDWFRKEYTEENWREIIESTRKESYARAAEMFKKRSNVRGAREEMERTLSARAANADYFGLTDIGIEELKKTQKIILESIRRPKIVLDSVAFVWMVKYE